MEIWIIKGVIKGIKKWYEANRKKNEERVKEQERRWAKFKAPERTTTELLELAAIDREGASALAKELTANKLCKKALFDWGTPEEGDFKRYPEKRSGQDLAREILLEKFASKLAKNEMDNLMRNEFSSLESRFSFFELIYDNFFSGVSERLLIEMEALVEGDSGLSEKMNYLKNDYIKRIKKGIREREYLE